MVNNGLTSVKIKHTIIPWNDKREWDCTNQK